MVNRREGDNRCHGRSHTTQLVARTWLLVVVTGQTPTHIGRNRKLGGRGNISYHVEIRTKYAV